jgi:hypothetical protein
MVGKADQRGLLVLTFLSLSFTGVQAAQPAAAKPLVIEPRYKMRIERNVLIPTCFAGVHVLHE